MSSYSIGVLALQGNFASHMAAFKHCGADCYAVRRPRQLMGLAGLVIPGGETTTLKCLMAPLNMEAAIVDFVRQGGAIYGTCAGLIIMAKHIFSSVNAAPEAGLNLLDVDVLRNAYGRQRESHTTVVDAEASILGAATLAASFVRAPKLTRVGAKVQVLARQQGLPVLVQQDRCLAASFHPELGGDGVVERYFLNMLTAA